jgi:hypothetical protein
MPGTYYGWISILVYFYLYTGFFLSFLHKFLRLVKCTAKPNAYQRRVINTIPGFDWPIIMIGTSALLLVVSHLFAVPVSVLWMGLEKGK